MRTSDFDFVLPPDRVAAHPAPTRDAARLLVLDRHTGVRKHGRFTDIVRLLPPRSLLVVNDARVIAARLRGRKETGGAMEIMLTQKVGSRLDGEGRLVEIWEALGRGLPSDPRPHFEFGGRLSVTVVERRALGRILVEMIVRGEGDLLSTLDDIGEIPLPPYIQSRRRADGEPPLADSDRHRYQTVYATTPGAVAAPTAGLHFTPQLLDTLADAGHQIVPLTLHVGPGTFRPVETDDVTAHEMDEERFSIPPATAEAVNAAQASGRPVVAVGTTVVRALESSARVGAGAVQAGTSASRLFLVPGAEFMVVTDLVTNFHLPRSTLLMLVAAFAGRDPVLAAYADAVEHGYRFYSYGDAMFITHARPSA